MQKQRIQYTSPLDALIAVAKRLSLNENRDRIDSMDTQLKYPNIIKHILKNHAEYRANLPDSYTSQVIFDDERGQYLVLDIGWNGDKYLHTTPIHLSLINDKVWVQYDDTEEGIVTDLIEAGIPKEKIVLGFRHPKIRKHTGFAVA